MDTFSEYMPYAALLLSIFALVVSAMTLWTQRESQSLNEEQFAKIVEDSKKDDYLAVNPSWFTRRMTTDNWFFGLLTTNGEIIMIEKIIEVSPDGKWLEVTLLTADSCSGSSTHLGGTPVFAVADDRKTASVQVSNIVMALEMASS